MPPTHVPVPAASIGPTSDTASSIRAAIQASMGQVRMLPDVAAQALDLAKDPDVSIGPFVRVIERDIELAANILSLANSALYSAPPVANLRQATERIGFSQCKNLILASSLSSLMKKMTLREEWIRAVLWQHSVLTAMTNVRLNQFLRAGFCGEEFTAGLIHDLGRTLLAVAIPDRFSFIDPLDFEESQELLQHEQGLIETDHCDIGAWYATEQGLPMSLIEVIRYHHHPNQAKSNDTLVLLTAFADHVSNHYQRTGESHSYDATTNPALMVLATRFPGSGDRLAEKAITLLDEAIEASQDLLTL